MTESADAVARAVLAVNGVAALHDGMFGEVATYLPGRRLAGVRLLDPGADVHVSVYYDAPIRGTAAAIRDRVAALVGTPVNVTVEDIVAPGEVPAAAAPPAAGSTFPEERSR